VKCSTFSEPCAHPSIRDLSSFFSKIHVAESGCWLWTAGRNYKGYGTFRSNCAHRFSHAWFIGVIPPRYEVDHLCRVRECVNPAHLEAVTVMENHRRSTLWWVRGVCIRGHKMTPENTYTYQVHGEPQRCCRKCRRASRRRWLNRRAPAHVLQHLKECVA
jgi:hypothetical protein